MPLQEPSPSSDRPTATTMVTKLCPKIILEGTRLTGKTDIALTLNEHPRIVGTRKYRYHSPIVSAEWSGFTKAPWGASLINFEPHDEPIVLETYQTWARLFELYKYYSWISIGFTSRHKLRGWFMPANDMISAGSKSVFSGSAFAWFFAIESRSHSKRRATDG